MERRERGKDRGKLGVNNDGDEIDKDEQKKEQREYILTMMLLCKEENEQKRKENYVYLSLALMRLCLLRR